MESVFSVSEVNNYISKVLLDDFILQRLSVRGEVFNVKYHNNVIFYTLKDAKSSLRCIMSYDNLKDNLPIKNGIELVIYGKIQVSSYSGNYSIWVDNYEESGIGLLYREFNERKEKFLKKGYFEESRKRPIPNCRNIGVVTSMQGAVIRDIISVAGRRNPSANIYLFPALVQGEGAASEIIKGIVFFNEKFPVDVIIFGRGGGSYEELSIFNDEELCETVFNSKIPTISAVGHESDIVLTDFVADKRASTPSQAAELSVEDVMISKDKILSIKKRLNYLIEDIIYEKEKNFKNLSTGLRFSINNTFVYHTKYFNSLKLRLSVNEPTKKLVMKQSYVYKLENDLNYLINTIILDFRRQVERLECRLETVYKDLILKSKPEITDSEKNIIQSIHNLKKDDELYVVFPDGRVYVKILTVEEG